MAEHTIQIGTTERKRYTNDPVYHSDVESQLTALLEYWWVSANTQNIKPKFYLTEKEITHDISVCPAIVVYQNYNRTSPVGLGYTAERLEMPMTIEIISIDRGMLYDTADEVHRILKFCRKRPIPEWDVVLATSNKRAEPRAGNYHYVTSATLIRYVKPILAFKPPTVPITPIPIIVGEPSLDIGVGIAMDAEGSLLIGITSLATGGTAPYTYACSIDTNEPITTRIATAALSSFQIAADMKATDNNSKSIQGQLVFMIQGETPPTPHTMTGDFNVVVTATMVELSIPMTIAYHIEATGGTGPYTYEWYYDDYATPVVSQDCVMTYDSIEGIHEKVLVFDSKGTGVSATMNITS